MFFSNPSHSSRTPRQIHWDTIQGRFCIAGRECYALISNLQTTRIRKEERLFVFRSMVSLSNSHCQRGLAWCRALCVAFLFSCLLSGFVPFGKAGSRPESNSGPSPVASEFAIADFDGDSRPDLATVHGGQGGFGDTRYFIDFQLTTGLRHTIGVTAPTGGLRLTSRDVNGDDFLDVIVTTSWTNQPVAVLLNDGRGNFTQSDPSTFPGAFATSENYLVSKPDAITDATAALLWRYLSGECEECEGAASPQVVAGRPVTSVFAFAALSSSDSFFGRAPPSLAPRR